MGPSGSGKTTLLNHLARRNTSASATDGTVLINQGQLSASEFRKLTSYVEQDDALIGSLTVRETVDFNARLSFSSTISKKERLSRVDQTIEAFGLTEQAHTLIGTPLTKGISGGQKRRTSVAAQIITDPKILFLDEPTSGLDSAASFEIVSYLKEVASRYKLLVIASIHQPSTSTFALFDKIILLSQGKTCYFGPISEVNPYFRSIGCPIPAQTNPAEHLLDVTNIDFARNRDERQAVLSGIHASWKQHQETTLPPVASQASSPTEGDATILHEDKPHPNTLAITLILLSRMFIKSYRDVVAYGIRIAMYLGLAIMMGTVWLRCMWSSDV